MKRYRRLQLRKELRIAGADKSELRALLFIADGLRLSRKGAGQDAAAIRWPRRRNSPRFTLAGLLVCVCLFFLYTSQSALPTSWLYSVQKATDAIAIAVHPAYRADVMMKRARQVNELVARGAASHDVLGALAAYVHEARAYKNMPHDSDNYAAFNSCSYSLKQAAASASPLVRDAIDRVVRSLEST